MFKFRKNYHIVLDDEAWVAPEETIIDTGSEYANLERPLGGSVFSGFMAGVVIILSVILFFVLKMSFFENAYYSGLAFQNKAANFPLSPPRGVILDSSGEVLVKNIPIFELLVVSREIKQDSENLDSKLESIAKILDIPYGQLAEKMSDGLKTKAIFFLARDLGKDQALAIEYLGPPGLYIISETKRDYISSHKFSQILGYIGKVNKQDLEDSYYFPTDKKGRLGIEAQYEEALRGEHGNIFFTADKSGGENKNPVPGNSLVLNIDAKAQEQLHDVMWNILRESNLSRAAAIVQNPKNGAVLAMVSFPTFDNNIFGSEISVSTFQNLFQSRSKPLFNRIISGKYNPGSTIKPYIGMTALQENVVDPDDRVYDCISINVGEFVFRNWRPETGPFDLRKAIANSCNVYFYSVGGGYGNIKGLGISRISDYLKRGLADSKLGIDLPGEETGFVPTPEWKERTRGESWYLGDTYNTSIGQGDLLVSPLWLNAYVSAIANGGTMYKPRVASRVINAEQVTIESFKAQEIGKLPFDKPVIDEMKAAMRETVVSGTAKLLNSLPVKVAAKTGTAEVVKGQSINALFTAFAPYEDPEVAITILFEGSASNEGYAIRSANGFLKWYFDRESKK